MRRLRKSADKGKDGIDVEPEIKRRKRLRSEAATKLNLERAARKAEHAKKAAA